MINSYENEKNAASRRLDIDREVAAANLRRQAKAARHADRSSAPSDLAVAAPLAGMRPIGPVAGAWRSLGHGLAAVVGRRVPA